MNPTRWLISATILAATVCSGALAFSAEDDAPKDRGWYIGGGIGAADDHDFDETEAGGKFFGGYRVGRYFAAEAAAVYLGNYGRGTLGIGDGGEFDKYSFTAQGVGILPVGRRAELLVKAGLSYWSVDVVETCTVSGGQQVCVDDGTLDEGVDAVYGVGFQYHFSDRWGGRIEWERYNDVGEDDLDFLSISVLFRF
ncbi:MAG TPA: porin family protein [Burkholderiales bacterium]|nr:porin family protein [Burkholderiales bacterium]